MLLEQETVSGSGISWVICKSAPRSRQCYLPPDRADIPALVLDYATPEGCKAELILLAGYIPIWHTRPKVLTGPNVHAKNAANPYATPPTTARETAPA